MELNYLVRGADGNQYGPASLEEMSTWIKEGRIGKAQEVQRSDMQYWAAAEGFTEFQPAFAVAPVAAAAPQPARTAAPAGRVNMMALAQVRSNGSWFYWVAGLSLVNTISALSGSDWRFIIGLGITQVIDVFGAEMGAKTIALALDLLVAGVFVALGVFANKAHTWAFVVGMILFALDGVIMGLAKDWIGVGFHVFVLYCFFRGFNAAREFHRSLATSRA